MNSHLSISYNASPPAGAPAAATAASAQSQSPLGSLGIVFDQLLAGATANPTTSSATDTATAASLSAPIPPTTSQPPFRSLALLHTLAGQLGDLKDQLDNGDEPDKDKLQALSDTIDALTALLTGPAVTAAPATADAATSTSDPATDAISAPMAPTPAAAPSTRQQRLANLAAALASTFGVTAPPAPGTTALPDKAVALLQRLGLSTTSFDLPALLAGIRHPQASAAPGDDGTSATTPSRPFGHAIASLSQKLTDLSVALTAANSAIARKLETLSTALSATRDGPDPTSPATSSSGSTATTQAAALMASARTVIESIISRLDGSNSPAQIAIPVTNPSPNAGAKSQAQVASRTRDDDPAASSATTTVPVEKVLKLAALELTPTPTKPDCSPNAEQQLAALDTTDTTSRTDPPSALPPAPSAAAQPNHARTLPAAYQTASNPINMGQVAFEMVRQAHQGLSRFAIRLDPPELGRVDVRMNVDPSGGVTAKLTVERPETLDMFQRDQRTLERALQQAGLDSARTTLEFSLRQNSNPFAGMAGGDQRQSGSPPPYSRVASTDDDAVPLASVTTLYRGTASAGGVNLFV